MVVVSVMAAQVAKGKHVAQYIQKRPCIHVRIDNIPYQHTHGACPCLVVPPIYVIPPVCRYIFVLDLYFEWLVERVCNNAGPRRDHNPLSLS